MHVLFNIIIMMQVQCKFYTNPLEFFHEFSNMRIRKCDERNKINIFRNILGCKRFQWMKIEERKKDKEKQIYFFQSSHIITFDSAYR